MNTISVGIRIFLNDLIIRVFLPRRRQATVVHLCNSCYFALHRDLIITSLEQLNDILLRARFMARHATMPILCDTTTDDWCERDIAIEKRVLKFKRVCRS